MRKTSSLVATEAGIDRLTTETDYDNIVIVKDSIADVTAVAGSIVSVNTVAGSIAAVDALSSIKAKLDSLYADKATLDSLYTDKTTLDSLYADKLTLDSLFADKTTLDSLFADKSTLDSIFADKATLDSIFTDKLTLDSLFTDKATLDRLYTSIANIDRVFTSIGNIDIVAGDIDNINTVAADLLLGKGTNTSTDSAVLNTLGNATQARLDKWIAEATKMTANSYATEPYGVFVKVYTSDGDGTFTATNTAEYSALHWQKQTEVDSTDLRDIANNWVLVRYDKKLASMSITAMNYDGNGNLVEIIYDKDDGVTYYRDALVYNVSNALGDVYHFYGTTGLDTATDWSGNTKLTYDATSGALVSSAYTEQQG